MKNATNIGMLVAVVFAVGMVGINFSDGTFIAANDSMPISSPQTGMLSGHLEIIHTDPEGNILSYQQTDNAIVPDGKNCVGASLFTANLGTNTVYDQQDGCTDISPGNYTSIILGNGTTLATSTSISRINVQGEITTNGLGGSGASDIALTTNATGTNSAVFTITKVFTADQTGANGLVNQASLSNHTNGVGNGGSLSTFALKDFPSSVNLSHGDQLTVNWEITIAGSTGLN